ncbi:MAG: SoxR reducing system RseC family protein [Prevotellaceae bacterium]|jgi:sigma-E factor negative regulatory protein RseC|nr:SoxR reducing system RseC family protein [Prevotellaceae bacterium]
MTETIEHQGIVESVNGQHVRVRIEQVSACASCSVKAHCSSADTREKMVDAVAGDGTRYAVGDAVTVCGALSMGRMAVVLAFVVPFVVLVAALFTFMTLWQDELEAASAALALLIPYYIVLWLMRSRLKRTFAFSVKPLRE